eukprot:4287211-Pyramimonas_sp.AAC.1
MTVSLIVISPLPVAVSVSGSIAQSSARRNRGNGQGARPPGDAGRKTKRRGSRVSEAKSRRGATRRGGKGAGEE